MTVALPRAARGFTLMELMIAVALLAMMGLILGTSITTIMGSIRDNREMQDRYHAARVALGRMQHELAMAYVSRHQGENGATKTIFIGKPNKLQFTYMGHRRIARGGVESDQGVVEYSLEKRAGGLARLVRREKVIIDDTPEKGGRKEVLADGVRKLEFAYWSMDKEEWETDWKVEIDRAAEEQRQKQAAAAAATGMTGNAALANAIVKQASRRDKERHGPDEQWLPVRVRIRMTLATVDEDLELDFETQARLRISRPLDFQQAYSPGAYDNSLNPYGVGAGITPPGFNPQQILNTGSVPSTGGGGTP